MAISLAAYCLSLMLPGLPAGVPLETSSRMAVVEHWHPANRPHLQQIECSYERDISPNENNSKCLERWYGPRRLRNVRGMDGSMQTVSCCGTS